MKNQLKILNSIETGSFFMKHESLLISTADAATKLLGMQPQTLRKGQFMKWSRYSKRHGRLLRWNRNEILRFAGEIK